MADQPLGFEGRTAQQRQEDRTEKRRKLELWSGDTALKRILKDNGRAVELVQEAVEEVVVGLTGLELEGAQAAARNRMLERSRQGHRQLQQLYV